MISPTSSRSRAHIPAGTRFHKLTVVRRATSDGAGRAQFLCRCECGTVCHVRGADLRSGHTKSCGCRRSTLARQRLGKVQMKVFGSVLVLGKADPENNPEIKPNTRWVVVCKVCHHRCFEAVTRTVRSGKARCACLTRTYTSWRQMIQRCTNKNHQLYKDYGGRGISVCVQWRKSFLTFVQYMGQRPEGKTLDRHPNPDGNYEPGNCRWGTPGEQAKSRRKNS
jgi:hypothetical protein